MSGSSHVEAGGPSFRLSSDTPCIAFADEAHERPFHDGFRANEQVAVDLAAGAIRDALAPLAGLLATFAPDLPHRTLWASPGEREHLEAPDLDGPWILRAPFGAPGWLRSGIVTLELAFAGPTPRAELEALLAQLAAAVSARCAAG